VTWDGVDYTVPKETYPFQVGCQWNLAPPDGPPGGMLINIVLGGINCVPGGSCCWAMKMYSIWYDAYGNGPFKGLVYMYQSVGVTGPIDCMSLEGFEPAEHY
jgi:hypothetical protein